MDASSAASPRPGHFTGKSIIITGASSGLGACLAREFARHGANLTLFSPEAEAQEQVAAQCRGDGTDACAVIGDVTQPADCQRLVQESVTHFGRVDYLIANAGISMWALFDQVEDLGVFRRLMEVNYLGALHCVHYALPELKKTRGMIVAISSIQAKIGVPMHTGYVASKHALQGFCETLRMELDGTGVDILTVMPHWLRGTDLRQHALSQDGTELGQSSRRHSSESVSLEDATAAIMESVRRRRRDLIIPWKLRALLALNQFFPALAESIIKGAVHKQDS
jgi:NAD(P)-dependent dehydrogenase (short-subunit alcohol dehydrogenase family)